MAEQPVAALVNIVDPEASRILLAPLAAAAGGWGQVKGWDSKEDHGYEQMRILALGTILFSQFQDIEGTCGRGSSNGCLCKACWIREQTTSSAGRQPTASSVLMGEE